MGSTSFPTSDLEDGIQTAIQTLGDFAGKKTVVVPELDLEFIKERGDLPRAPFALVFVTKSAEETGRPHATYLGVFEATVRVVVDRKINMDKTLQAAGGLHAQVEAVQSKVVSSFVGFDPALGGSPSLLTVLEWQGNSDYDTLDEWIFEDIFLKATYSEDGFLDNA